jgi:beta-lactamase superfamily II metal-dependent hydrolase
MADSVVHLLDVGNRPYGDCVLISFDTAGGPTWVLIDGGHLGDDKLILGQLKKITGMASPVAVDLLIVSHAHDDHIGALPKLVADGDLTAKHALLPDSDMAFGPPDAVDGVPPAVASAFALLREEPLVDSGLDAADIQALALDAVTLRSRFDTMRSTLEDAGTGVVTFGPGSRTAVTALQHTFSSIGFKVFGPSRKALQAAQELLFEAAAQIITDAAEFSFDGANSAAVLQALDAKSRAGFLVNAQSVVCMFDAAPGNPRRLLFGGDFQFADLDTDDATLAAECDALLGKIKAKAPYAFAKLCHHGSENAVGEAFLDAIGDTDAVGICCGRGDPQHPDPETLELLAGRGQPTWVRTDRSGHVEVHITPTKVVINPKDAVDIADLNEPDAAPSGAQTPAAVGLPAVTSAATIPRTVADDVDRLVVEIPRRATTLDIHLELAPATTVVEQRPAAEATTTLPSVAPQPSTDQRTFAIGGGERDLGNLLFVTHTARLTGHLDPSTVAVIKKAIDAGNYHLLDLAEAGASELTANDVEEAIHRSIADYQPQQVIILGSYDIVPAVQVDAVAPETPAQMVATLRRSDPDGFVVWSDDPYVDVDGSGLPDTAISRIPDGRDALFTLKALQAVPASARQRHGVRNSLREFVIPIFGTLPGASQLYVSGPDGTKDLVAGVLQGSLAYYMLHGDDADGKHFWGEQPRGVWVEAVTIDTVPKDDIDTAVMGCCWGALPASTKAADWEPGQTIAGRSPDQSIALTLLSAGARAVIGCTGAHYSPLRPPYDTASGPLHQALWTQLNNGMAPAEALLHAKYAYAEQIKSVTDVNQLAIANKTLSQFTCLGLGR